VTNPDTDLEWVEQAWGIEGNPAGQDGPPRAHARDCAVENGPGEVPPPVPSLGSLTAQARLALAQNLTQLLGPLTVLAARKDSLLHAQPPSILAAAKRHKECADHLNWPPFQAGRLGYGAVHTTVIKPFLNYVEWATRSPLSLFIHVLIGAAVWAALVLGGYL
jgi:hypothetical protein